MGFLRRIFGGSGSEKDSGPTDTAWHFYVKSKHADEIIDVRVDPDNDLSPEFDGAGDGASHYTANKDIVGGKSFKTINLHLIFDTTRSFRGDYTIDGGELVDKAQYDAWRATEEAVVVGDTDSSSD